MKYFGKQRQFLKMVLFGLTGVLIFFVSTKFSWRDVRDFLPSSVVNFAQIIAPLNTPPASPPLPQTPPGEIEKGARNGVGGSGSTVKIPSAKPSSGQINPEGPAKVLSPVRVPPPVQVPISKLRFSKFLQNFVPKIASPANISPSIGGKIEKTPEKIPNRKKPAAILTPKNNKSQTPLVQNSWLQNWLVPQLFQKVVFTFLGVRIF